MKQLLHIFILSCMAFAQHHHYDQVNRNGDVAMGFSHEKTTHHFGLSAEGGSIEVSALDAADDATKQAIRTHLQHISHAFHAGDFTAPEQTHSQVPPGTQEMTRLRDHITYRYAETPSGGKVIISSRDEAAVKAIHEFLRFQIQDHRTGDSLKVQP